MKVGDLVKHRFRKRQNKVFLVVKTAADIDGKIIWLYPDTGDGLSHHYSYSFEVVSESG